MTNITKIDLNPTNIVNSAANSVTSQATGYTSQATGLIDGATSTATNAIKSNVEQYTGVIDKYIDTSKVKSYLKELKETDEEYSVDDIIEKSENKLKQIKDDAEKEFKTIIEEFEFPDFDIEALVKEITKQVDKAVQDVANVPAKIINDIEKTVKKILNIIDGWIDTSEEIIDVASSGKAMGKMVNDAIDQLGKLPLPAIPGLDMLKNLVGQVLNIKIPSISDITGKATNIVSNSANSITKSVDNITNII